MPPVVKRVADRWPGAERACSSLDACGCCPSVAADERPNRRKKEIKGLMTHVDREINEREKRPSLSQRLECTAAVAPDLAPVVHRSLQLLRGVTRIFEPEEIALSFNGGKDATVVFHLTRAVFETAYAEREQRPRIQAVFFDETDPGEQFPEVLDFVTQWSQRYAHILEFVRVPGGIFHGLKMYLTEICPQVRCFLLGTRWIDPDGPGQEHLSPSSPQWPAFLRVNPILHWSYRAVWRFLRVFDLEYCSLYDQGYTSIGRVSDTERNPRLRRNHAHFEDFTHLERDQDERCGRKPRQRTPATHLQKQPSEHEGAFSELLQTPNWISLLFVGTDPSRWFDGIIEGNAVGMFLRELEEHPWRPRQIQVVSDWLDGLSESIQYATRDLNTQRQHNVLPVLVLAYDGSGSDVCLLMSLVDMFHRLAAVHGSNTDDVPPQERSTTRLLDHHSSGQLRIIILPLGWHVAAPARVVETLYQAMECPAISMDPGANVASPFLAEREQIRLSLKRVSPAQQGTQFEPPIATTLFEETVRLDWDQTNILSITVNKEAYGRFLEVLEQLDWLPARM